MIKDYNYQIICQEVCDLARKTGAFLKDEIHKIKSENIEHKGAHDFVTYVDKTSESRIVEALSKILPVAGFIAEENKSLPVSDNYNWIIDPLDGTTNYIHGIPLYSISIALVRGTQTVVGVVYEPNSDECFYAWEGSNAFLNHSPIRVSNQVLLNDTLFATGFPYYDYSKLRPFMEVFEYMIRNSRGLRRLGSAAIDLAWVACGRIDGFFEYGLHPWDVAAGAFIVERAGGKNSDFSGSDNYIFGKEIVSSNPYVFNEFIDVIDRHFSSYKIE